VSISGSRLDEIAHRHLASIIRFGITCRGEQTRNFLNRYMLLSVGKTISRDPPFELVGVPSIAAMARDNVRRYERAIQRESRMLSADR
jgi:hypothetical protein